MVNGNGIVTTGFSRIHVAKYSNEGPAVTYTGCRELARAKKMESEVEFTEGSVFKCNNEEAESTPRKFKSGKVNITVDGLTGEEYEFLMGIVAELIQQVQVLNFGDVKPPYLGLGAIKRMQSHNVESWRPIIFMKVQFDIPKESAETEEDEGVSWQPQELHATIKRDDTAKHNWQMIPKENFETEQAAVDFIKKVLGGGK